ncbi:MAG: hypothetical protein IH867_09545 [Chloroflexi bacterium]|nr:hypothetical protein [Chloroflexota bacterium]
MTSGAATTSITVIGGGFGKGEKVSLSAKNRGFDFLLADTEANANGAFEITVDLAMRGSDADDPAKGFPAGGVFTITASGDQGNRGASAFVLVEK